MALRTETKIIEGDRPLPVTVQQHLPRPALRLSARMLRTFGPALVTLIESGSILRVNAAELMYAIANLSDDAADEFACELFKGTTVVHAEYGKLDLCDASKINLAFEGDLLQMCRAMLFALEINFANFTAGLGKALEGLVPAELLAKLKAKTG